MRPGAWVGGYPHVCLWSPQLDPRTPNWDDTIRIAGYAYPSAEMDDHKPQKTLQVFRV